MLQRLSKGLRKRLARAASPEVYVSWEACAAAAGSYSDSLVNEFRAARTALNVKLAWMPEILETPLPWLSMVFPGPLAVTDLGGATGEMGLALQAFRPDVAYTVVENPTLARIMVGTESIRWATDLPPKCDIFYTSGTLTYLSDPYHVFDKAAKSAWLAMAVTRNCFSEREVFTVQRSPLHNNGGGGVPPGFPNATIACPHRTVSEARLRAIADANGFRLVSRITAPAGVPSGHEGYGADLVFLKA